MKWYFTLLIAIVILAFVGGLMYREKLMRQYPSYVKNRQKLMRNALSDDSIARLNETFDPIIDFSLRNQPETLLYWTGKYMEYANPNNKSDPNNAILNELRARADHYDPNVILEYGVGRCEEFSIVFAAFLKCAGREVHLIYDFSTGISDAGKRNGDHVWVEVDYTPPLLTTEDKIRRLALLKKAVAENDASIADWVHIDPTEGAIWAFNQSFYLEMMTGSYDLMLNPFVGDPEMYERDWKKDLKEVWAIDIDHCERVEDKYQWEEES